MYKLLFTFSLLLILSFPTQAGQTSTASQFTGEWTGTGTQSDGSHWSIRVNSRPDGYFIEYPSLLCGGVWKLVKATKSDLVFKEMLIYGIERCVDHGEVVIHKLAEDKASYAWSNKTNKITATGNLTRKPHTGGK